MPEAARPSDYDVQLAAQSLLRGELSKEKTAALAAALLADQDVRRQFEDIVVVHGMFRGAMDSVLPRRREDCATIKPLLASAARGDVEALELLRLSRHVDACESCGRTDSAKRRTRGKGA